MDSARTLNQNDLQIRFTINFEISTVCINYSVQMEKNKEFARRNNGVSTYIISRALSTEWSVLHEKSNKEFIWTNEIVFNGLFQNCIDYMYLKWKYNTKHLSDKIGWCEILFNGKYMLGTDSPEEFKTTIDNFTADEIFLNIYRQIRFNTIDNHSESTSNNYSDDTNDNYNSEDYDEYEDYEPYEPYEPYEYSTEKILYIIKRDNFISYTANCVKCQICLQTLENAQMIETPCKHIYHFNCLKTNLKYNRNCPLCRCDFTTA